MRVLLLITCIVGFAQTIAAQDTILTTQNKVIACIITSVGEDGITFRLPPNEETYKMYLRNVKEYYSTINKKWITIDTVADSIRREQRIAEDTKMSANSYPTNNSEKYLEKAGNNLILGAVLPLGGMIVGLSTAVITNTKGGLTAGVIIASACSFAGLVCDIFAGINLIKAQQYQNLTNIKKGFNMGLQTEGIGFGYRF